jgi:hypothetical protein
MSDTLSAGQVSALEEDIDAAVLAAAQARFCHYRSRASHSGWEDLPAEEQIRLLAGERTALLAALPYLHARPQPLSPLADLLRNYLAARQHTLSTAHLTGMDLLLAEARYVKGEAEELYDAVVALALADARGEATPAHWRDVEKEIADVALADTTMAGFMPGTVTVEQCILAKTEADRGRG